MNSGTSQQTVVVVKQSDSNLTCPKAVTLLANEQVEMYFWCSHISKVASQSAVVGGTLGRIQKFAMQRKKVKFQQKNYEREYSAMLYRTYSYIDLLDLLYIEKTLRDNENF